MSADHHERQPRPDKAADVFPVHDAEVCGPSDARLSPMWPMDLGEQVIGTKHEFQVEFPRNNLGEAQDAWVKPIALAGSKEISIPMTGEEQSLNNGKPFSLAYAPIAPGVHNAVLTLQFRWRDGTTETHSVQISARARKIDAVPDSSLANAPPTTTHKQPAPTNGKDVPLTVDANTAWQNVKDAHTYLMNQQRAGVDAVAREAERFKPKPAPRSLWEDLVELAIQMGTAGVGALVAKFVAERVGKFAINAEKFEERAESVAHAESAADKSARNAVEGPIVPTPHDTTADNAARHAKTAEHGLIEGLGAGVEEALVGAAENLKLEDGDGDKAKKKVANNADDTASPSGDDKIAFFVSQESLINRAQVAGASRLNGIVAELLKQRPDVATDVIQGVMTGLTEAADKAITPQANATSAKFATYNARLKLGTEEVDTKAGKQVVTKLEEQRSFPHPIVPASLASGVLQLNVTRDANGGVTLNSAAMNDISYLTADRLLGQDLRTLGVPIRISLVATIITVDEVGRVRVAGVAFGPDEAGQDGSEAQRILEAERIAHVALSKTLRSWGIDRISTNDGNQPKPAKHETNDKKDV